MSENEKVDMVGVEEFRARFSSLVDEIRLHRAIKVITRYGKPCAFVIPIDYYPLLVEAIDGLKTRRRTRQED